MLINTLLPTLLSTAKDPTADVRILSTTSMGYAFHPRGGISFAELDSRNPMSRLLLGGWLRYGHSKLANILYAAELARRYPSLTSLSIHPGVVATELISGQAWQTRLFIYITTMGMGGHLTPEQGAWNSVYCAAVAKKSEVVNGGFYYPVGVHARDKLNKTATDEELARKLFEWTQDVLGKF